MRTSKPLATICYLPKDDLLKRFERHKEKGWLQNFAFISHQKEKVDTKDHIHLLIIPNETIDTNSLWFREIWDVFNGDEFVSGVMPWRHAKITDWLLYSVHSVPYLKKKGLEKLFHYTFDDFVYSEKSWFFEEVEIAEGSQISPLQKMLECAKKNLDLANALEICNVSFGAMLSFKKVYEELREQYSDGGKSELRKFYEFNHLTGECKTYVVDKGVKQYV